MKIVADVMLIERSTARNSDRPFRGQTLEIVEQAPTVIQSVDGLVSVANHPTRIIWHGGSPKDLSGITDIRIESKGRTLIEASLNTHYGPPRAVSGGVSFDVLKGG